MMLMYISMVSQSYYNILNQNSIRKWVQMIPILHIAYKKTAFQSHNEPIVEFALKFDTYIYQFQKITNWMNQLIKQASQLNSY